MKRIVLKELRRARENRIPATLVTDLVTGAQTLIVGEAFYGDPLPDVPDLEQVIDQVMVKDKGRTIEAGDSRIFVQPFNPPLRMMIIGAVHISQALAPMAKGSPQPRPASPRGVRKRWPARRAVSPLAIQIEA